LKFVPFLFIVLAVAVMFEVAVSLAIYYCVNYVPLNRGVMIDLFQRLQNEGYKFVLPKQYNGSNGLKIAILVHDTDFNMEGAKTCVEVETQFNIKSAFYLRVTAEYFTQSIEYFQGLEGEGWEIGLHYDSWSRTYPNTELGQQVFTGQVQYLRTFFTVRTTRAHGDKYNFGIDNFQYYNEKLWTNLGLRDFSTLRENFTYIRDTNKRYVEPNPLQNLILINLHTDFW